MKYERFEHSPVWSAGIHLSLKTYVLTAEASFKGHAGLRDQTERAALSVSNNIDEGFERGTSNELLTSLYIARGSAGEVRSMLCLLERLPAYDNFKSEIISRRHLAPASRLGRFSAKFKHQGSKVFN